MQAAQDLYKEEDQHLSVLACVVVALVAIVPNSSHLTMTVASHVT